MYNLSFLFLVRDKKTHPHTHTHTHKKKFNMVHVNFHHQSTLSGKKPPIIFRIFLGKQRKITAVSNNSKGLIFNRNWKTH